MNRSDIDVLFGHERRATRRVPAALGSVSSELPGTEGAIDEPAGTTAP